MNTSTETSRNHAAFAELLQEVTRTGQGVQLYIGPDGFEIRNYTVYLGPKGVEVIHYEKEGCNTASTGDDFHPERNLSAAGGDLADTLRRFRYEQARKDTKRP